jgi:hypothetical protein
MLLEDVLEILPLLMPKTFIDQFMFVWGCEQCTATSWFTHLVYYYLKDLDRVHLACKGLLYGDKDQTVLIDDEPNKAFQNPKWSKLFLEPFKGHESSKHKVQWLDCILVVASVERIAPCKNGLCPFRNHYVALKATIQFPISALFLVQAV